MTDAEIQRYHEQVTFAMRTIMNGTAAKVIAANTKRLVDGLKERP